MAASNVLAPIKTSRPKWHKCPQKNKETHMLSNDPHVRFFIGDVRDKDRLILLMHRSRGIPMRVMRSLAFIPVKNFTKK